MNASGATNASLGIYLFFAPCPTRLVINFDSTHEYPLIVVDNPPMWFTFELSSQRIECLPNQDFTNVRMCSLLFVMLTVLPVAFPSATNNPKNMPFSSFNSKWSGMRVSFRTPLYGYM